MMHEALLNAYIFDFLRKKGFLQTAVLFAEECKSLPLASTTNEDPQVSMPPGFSPKPTALLSSSPSTSTLATSVSGTEAKDTTATAATTSSTAAIATATATTTTALPAPAASTPAATANTTKNKPLTHDSASPAIQVKTESPSNGSALAQSPLMQQSQLHRVPAVNIPINTQKGFLLEWWSIFWDVFAASSDRRPGAAVPESIRTYLQHQNQKRTHRGSELNTNGKRAASQEACDQGSLSNTETEQPTSKRTRNNGDRSPQSAALVAKYALPENIATFRGTEQLNPQATHAGLAAGSGSNNGSVGMPTIPRGPGVNIGPAGSHMPSADYTSFLSRSFKMVTEGNASGGAGASSTAPTPTASVAPSTATHAVAAPASHPIAYANQQQQQQQLRDNVAGVKHELDSGSNAAKSGIDGSPMSQASQPQFQQQIPPTPGKMHDSSQQPQPQQQQQTLPVNRVANPFASPSIANSSIPRSVPTQRTTSHPLASPLVSGTTANPASIQAMPHFISPTLNMASPMASIANEHARRASLASVNLRMQTQSVGPGGNPGPMPRVGSVGPQGQPPQMPRQQTVPGNFTSGMSAQGMAGISPAELGFHGNPSALAAVAAGFSMGTSNQAMMAYVHHHHHQQQHQQQQLGATDASHPALKDSNSVGGHVLPQSSSSGIPGNEAAASINRQGQQQQQQQPQLPHHQQLGVLPGSQPQMQGQFMMIPGVAEQDQAKVLISGPPGASLYQAPIQQPAMLPDQQNHHILQLHLQLQQHGQHATLPGHAIGQKPGVVGMHPNQAAVAKRSSGSEADSSANSTHGLAVISSPVPVPVPQPTLGAAPANPTPTPTTPKKAPAKPKARRTTKKTAKGAAAAVKAQAAANAAAANASAPANRSGTAPNIATTERGPSPFAAKPGVVGGTNSTSSSKMSASPALTVKAAAPVGSVVGQKALTGTPSPSFANNTNPAAAAAAAAAARTNMSVSDVGSVGLGGVSENESNGHGNSIASFGDNAFSTLLSQKANQATLQGGNGAVMIPPMPPPQQGATPAPPSSSTADLASTIGAMGVTNIDPSDLSINISEWLSDTNAEAFNDILGMGVTMGAGGSDHGGASNGGAGNQVMGAYTIGDAHFSSFINSSGGISSALSMPAGMASASAAAGPSADGSTGVFAPAATQHNL